MGILYSSDGLSKFRDAGIEAAGGIRSLRTSKWEALGLLQIFPGQPLSKLYFVVPEELVPPGGQRKLSQRTIDGTMSGRLAQGANNVAAERRSEWLGRSILAFWLPTGSKRGNGLQAYSFRKRCIALLTILEASVSSMGPDEGDFWPYVLAHQADDFVAITISKRSVYDMHMAVNLLVEAASSGLLPLPAFPLTSVPNAKVEGGYDQERTARKPPPPRVDAKKKPFPDKFVTELLSRAFWIQDNLAQSVIQYFDSLNAFEADGALSSDQWKPIRRQAIDSLDWRDAKGDLITELPFPIWQRRDQYKYEYSVRWPPQHYSTLRLVLRVIQVLNLCTVAFCTAARRHELQGMVHQAIVHEQDETVVEGITFKNTGRAGGRKRDWPLHQRAEKAIALQEQLAKLVRPDGKTYLWVTLQKYDDPVGSPLADPTSASVEVVRHLDLVELAEGSAHLHRWRHTTARMIGLAVENAPEVLMDLLGNNLEGVLDYLLSDPDLAKEAIRIAEEYTYALAEQAIKDVDDGVAGGPASSSIRQGIEELKMTRGIRRLGTDETAEAVKQLTASGTAFQVVRRGVICTKQPGEFGPCTKTLGRADKGSCRSTCTHRLELAAEKHQCERQIEAVLELITNATSAGQTMVVEHLKGQFIYEMERWSDVRSRIFGRHRLALELWDESSV
ncbi:hypothetical protein ELI01_09025 [Rhizobium leguminosarum]|uniref:hypothetical protein n=1 Tax=Rhizobium leguminosarum TaxID=384 RepID=UPI0010307620|nr:hypothetical protein [Rhizobium leguminosarum]TAX55361.1 hypothetical protein ELI01_09025 [Rhizobium leguminosarum]